MGEEVIGALRSYVSRLLELNIPLASAVLFGSRARGDWLMESDIDLLLILRQSNARFIDRIGELSRYWSGKWSLELFPYTISEVVELINRGSVGIYDALDHGIVIYDDGAFARLREAFRRAISEGVVRKVNGWWTIPSGNIT